MTVGGASVYSEGGRPGLTVRVNTSMAYMNVGTALPANYT
jgi:hypothetical protein